MRRILRQRKGFTLIEVMVALVLFAVGILAFAGLEVIVMKNQTYSKDFAKANAYAQQKAEELKAADWTTIADGSDTLEGKFTRAWDQTQEGTIRHVSITVTWSDPSYGQKSVSFYTDLYSNPSVGE